MFTPENSMDVQLVRSRRKTLAIQVRADGSVVVRAPYRTPERELRDFVQKHRDWIIRQQRKMAAVSAMKEQTEPLSELEIRKLAEAAAEDFSKRAAYYAGQVGVQYGRITIRHQKTKWGSCSAKGNLNFNCLLMLAPEPVRDYVVVHELCHRKQMNHSPSFWAEVGRVLPEYREARKWLRSHSAELMSRNPAK